MGLDSCYQIVGEGSVEWTDTLCSGWRLPTEAEWEYAARAGSEHPYSGSLEIDDVAWFRDNSTKTQVVGQKAPNDWGLHDMTGNVWEWVWDSWKRDYDEQDVTDPVFTSSSTQRKIYRGGGYRHTEIHNHIFFRNRSAAVNASRGRGFRLLRRKGDF